MPPQALIVTREEAGQKLLQFLVRRFDLPQTMLHRWIRTGQVRRNGGRCKPFDRVDAGDEVRVPPFAAAMSERAGREPAVEAEAGASPAPAAVGRTATAASRVTEPRPAAGCAPRSAVEPVAEDSATEPTAQRGAGARAVTGETAGAAKPGTQDASGPDGASRQGVRAPGVRTVSGAAVGFSGRSHGLLAGGGSRQGREDGPYASLPPIVAETEDLFIFDKPAGLPVHPGTGHVDSLTTRLESCFASASFMPTPAHRLDRDTSGLLLVARSYGMLRDLHEAFAAREGLVKEYLTWVAGRWAAETPVTLRDRLAKQEDARGRERVTAAAEGAEAACTVRCLHREARRSLLLVTLHTGRTHQIRVQLARRGHPLLGDVKYGGPPRARGFLLHAVRLCFPDGTRHVCLPAWTGGDALPQGLVLPPPLDDACEGSPAVRRG